MSYVFSSFYRVILFFYTALFNVCCYLCCLYCAVSQLLTQHDKHELLLYAFFWVITRRLEFICRRFGTLCLFHLPRQVDLPAYEDGTECSETSAYKLQTPGYYPKESIKYTEHGESLKSRIYYLCYYIIIYKPGLISGRLNAHRLCSL